MKCQTRNTVFHVAVILMLLTFRPTVLRSQVLAGPQRDSANANWSTTKHGKHLTIRVNPDADLSRYNGVSVGRVIYTGPEKRLKPRESSKLASLLHDSLTKDLSATRLSEDKSATALLTLNADITYVKRVHPWVNIVTMAAVFVPLDFGGANVTAWLMDQQTGQAVAEIETVGCGQIYEAFASLQSLGHAKLALKKDSRAIAKGFTSVDWNRRPLNVNAAVMSWND